MSDIHILTASDRHIYNVVMHFAVPDTTNPAGTNYRTALVNSGIGGSTALTEGVGAGQISTLEKSQVEAGELYEHRVSFNAEGNGQGAPEIREALRAFYTSEKTRKINELQNRLKYFGHLESQA